MAGNRTSWYSKPVKVAPAIAVVLGIALGGCIGSSQSGEIAPPVITVAPDDFVLRDVRKAAAPLLNCQAPMIEVHMGPWAGSEGNVIAAGCGYQITYYLRCQTNHQCTMNRMD